MSSPDPEPTAATVHLLERAAAGDRAAEERLLERLGPELHRIAEALLGRRAAAATLQPTALVDEAWMRVARSEGLAFDNRKAFLAFAARVMRNLLVDDARARAAAKRGGNAERVSLHAEALQMEQPQIELLDLEQALVDLEREDPESVRLVELRFFGGLTHAEIAELLGWSQRTVERRWSFARAWLRDALG